MMNMMIHLLNPNQGIPMIHSLIMNIIIKNFLRRKQQKYIMILRMIIRNMLKRQKNTHMIMVNMEMF